MAQRIPWTAEEWQATVDAYFQYWLGDSGDWDTKVDVYRDLHRRDPIRSEKSFEFAFQNVSGALYVLGLEHMPGLLPRVNFQAQVLDIVAAYLDAHSEIRSAIGPYEKSRPGAPEPRLPSRLQVRH
jgi:hypothetical protein